MRILITGQCTLHWGRLEYGNIGNYYIIETSIRELHRVFPEAKIVTTFQMTDAFCEREKVSCLPMDLFYSWSDDDLDKSLKELGIAIIYNHTGKLVKSTDYINEVLKSDLIVDFSGEMWGYHADLVGKNRFLVGLIKDRIPQLLNVPIVMIAGSQGRFPDKQIKEFAKIVFKDFKLVANRESETGKFLESEGFDIKNLKNYACPAFLFEPMPDNDMKDIYKKEKVFINNKRTVGFVLCGFNFIEGPYDKNLRDDKEYEPFVKAIEYIVCDLGGRVILMSHTNAFDLPPNFKLKPGRDFPIVKRLQQIVIERGNVGMEDVLCIENAYNPKETKAIIKQFDMFVSGRLHAAVAAISQCVPTVVIMHGHGQKSHKTIGFYEIVGLEEYVAYPNSSNDINVKIHACWNNLEKIRNHLNLRIPKVKQLAKDGFDIIKDVVKES
jgi:colanic acid/amylovoran biosynthesis protein